MTREEFDKLYLGKAVHCDTEEKAKEFLALADSVGYKWISRQSLITSNRWRTYNKETCYHVTKYGILFDKIDYYNLHGYYIIEYPPQLKFKVGDKIRVNNTLYSTVNGKVGVIERVNSLSKRSYAVKIDNDSCLWFLPENELEKVEEQPKFKEGDKVRIKNTLYTKLNGKVGVIESVDSLSIMPYAVKVDDKTWCLTENELEKVEEPTYKDETINNIIKEIKENQKRITVLLNRLEQEVKNK